ncbi:MAG: YidB family protein [Sulfuriferula sp.]
MSFFDEALNLVQSQLSGDGADQTGVMGAVTGLLNNSEIGGLSGLVAKLQQGGLGEVVSTWVGTGENQTVTADALQSALGSETVQNLAAKAGMAPETLSAGLAQMLPTVIDRLTPDGEVPAGDLLTQGMSLLKGKLFG